MRQRNANQAGNDDRDPPSKKHAPAVCVNVVPSLIGLKSGSDSKAIIGIHPDLAFDQWQTDSHYRDTGDQMNECYDIHFPSDLLTRARGAVFAFLSVIMDNFTFR